MVVGYEVLKLASVLLALLLLSNAELDSTGTPQVPSECNRTSELLLTDKCFNDSDCKGSRKCYFKGCTRQCINLQPCGNVVCKEGFLCQEEELPCDEPPCQKQGSCISLEKYRCRAQPECPQCDAGFEPQKDQDGCNISPCECVPSEAPRCGTTCHNLCAFGFELENGCLTCRCRPTPMNPCTDTELECDSDEECRFVDYPCEDSSSICKPVDLCIPKTKSPIDDRCSTLDSTTLGRPVLANDMVTLLNCSSVEPCPGNTICVTMREDLSICCWQHTQADLETMPSPADA